MPSVNGTLFLLSSVLPLTLRRWAASALTRRSVCARRKDTEKGKIGYAKPAIGQALFRLPGVFLLSRSLVYSLGYRWRFAGVNVSKMQKSNFSVLLKYFPQVSHKLGRVFHNLGELSTVFGKLSTGSNTGPEGI